jgi:hypothetical protein
MPHCRETASPCGCGQVFPSEASSVGVKTESCCTGEYVLQGVAVDVQVLVMRKAAWRTFER